MPVSDAYVREIFKGLEEGNGSAFFEHVDENVDWTVMGTRWQVVTATRRISSPVPSPSLAKYFQKERSFIWRISSSRTIRQWSSFIPWPPPGMA
jgi:hypothetical protein